MSVHKYSKEFIKKVCSCMINLNALGLSLCFHLLFPEILCDLSNILLSNLTRSDFWLSKATNSVGCPDLMFSVISVRAISAKSKSNPPKYSSKIEVQSKRNSNESLDPWFISGFSDGFFIKGIKQYSQSIHKPDLSLVIWGTNLTSTVGNKITRKELAMVCLAPYQYSVIIGLILSDGWITAPSKTNKNARLGFAQSGANGKYLWFVFFQLSHYCSSNPVTRVRTRFGKQTIGLQFFTRSMPCFTELYTLFYPSGVKVIPENIYELLTPVALAHLIMGDGQTSRHGLVLCTNSYSIQDVVKLMNVLIVRYKLECTIKEFRSNRKVEYMIYIKHGSMPLLRTIVKSYMSTSMLYKLDNSKASEVLI